MNYPKINLGYQKENPVFTNPSTASNGHIALIGVSGGGKSVEEQRIMCSILQQGGTIFNISHHGTFTDDQINTYYKGIIDHYRNDIDVYDGIPLPLFEPMKFADGSVEAESDVVGGVTEVVSRVYKLGSCQKEVLRGAVENVMENGSYNTNGIAAIGGALGGGYGATKEENAVFSKMESLFEHNVFRNGNNLILPNRLNTVYLDKMDLDSQDLVREFILSYLWRCGNAGMFKDNPVFIFIDECHNASSGTKDPLTIMMSEGRRMGINLVLTTQMINKRNALQKAMGQSDLILYFKPAASLLLETAQMINRANSAKWVVELRKLETGSFIACGSLLYGLCPINHPLVVNANVNDIGEYDVREGFFDNGKDDECDVNEVTSATGSISSVYRLENIGK